MDTGQIAITILLAWVTWWIGHSLYNIYLHPLADFPGPTFGRCSRLYKTWIDVVAQSSFVHTLEKLHKKYGEVVRVGPNELHFSRPATYHEIYNNNNRWDKEGTLYHSFGEDRSSFGYLAYKDAKNRKDILARGMSRRAIRDAEGIVRENVWRDHRSDVPVRADISQGFAALQVL